MYCNINLYLSIVQNNKNSEIYNQYAKAIIIIIIIIINITLVIVTIIIIIMLCKLSSVRF